MKALLVAIYLIVMVATCLATLWYGGLRRSWPTIHRRLKPRIIAGVAMISVAYCFYVALYPRHWLQIVLTLFFPDQHAG